MSGTNYTGYIINSLKDQYIQWNELLFCSKQMKCHLNLCVISLDIVFLIKVKILPNFIAFCRMFRGQRICDVDRCRAIAWLQEGVGVGEIGF